MQDILISIVSVAFVLGIMILVHEFGHYAAAKFFGVRVEVFSIGFGKRLIGFTRGDTDYRIAAIPLGGYVKMSGENSMESRTGAPYEFMSHPRWQRFIIAFAGPFMNIMLAIVLLTGVFMVHYEHPVYSDKPAVIGWVVENSPAAKAGFLAGDRIVHIDGLDNPTWEDVLPKVFLSPNQSLNVTIERDGQRLSKTITPQAGGPEQLGSLPGWVPDQPNTITDLEPNMPAVQAGMRVGDNIVALNGQATRSLPAMIRVLQENKSKPIEVTAVRDGQELKFTLTPKLDKLDNGEERYRIGMKSDPQDVGRLPLGKALSKSIEQNKKYSLLILELVKKMAQRKISIKQVEGPISIARESGNAAKQGWTSLALLMSAISLNLGIFNLFPFPILDGGMILMLAIESLRGKDISMPVKERVYQVAFVLLVLFAALVIFNDISKLPAFTQKLP